MKKNAFHASHLSPRTECAYKQAMSSSAIKPFSIEVKEGIERVLLSASPHIIEGFTVRLAQSTDIPTLMGLIHGLAEYEKEPHAVKITEAILRRDGFGPEPMFYVLLVEKIATQEPVGMAFCVFMYSTWEGRVLYLEDLFIYEPFRRFGIGTHLFKLLAKICVGLDCSRFEWKALDWNTPAIIEQASNV